MRGNLRNLYGLRRWNGSSFFRDLQLRRPCIFCAAKSPRFSRIHFHPYLQSFPKRSFPKPSRRIGRNSTGSILAWPACEAACRTIPLWSLFLAKWVVIAKVTYVTWAGQVTLVAALCRCFPVFVLTLILLTGGSLSHTCPAYCINLHLLQVSWLFDCIGSRL